MKKYKINVEGRIVALKTGVWGDVGTIGGFITAENNLSHSGDCWVYDNAKVSGDARVFGDAQVSGDAWVYGRARIFGGCSGIWERLGIWVGTCAWQCLGI